MKTSKIFIFSLALFGTLIIGGPALSPALSHGGGIAQAADTTITIPTTVHIFAMPDAPSSNYYNVPISYTNNQTTM
ncbi:hypothetical protein [Levilactobacillus paucivorans]|uniref:hypothetical protein n=1 Tax=Levilactobacillus paucivorans TaxID=616990 RepID=UPI00070DB7A7|nr:hypothetical protein [Levilactobacillus paucivorans]